MCDTISDFVVLYPIIKNKLECGKGIQFPVGVFPDFETYRYPLYYGKISVPANHIVELYPTTYGPTSKGVVYKFGIHDINDTTLMNGIRSIKVSLKQTGADFRLDCCRGLNDPGECGIYSKTSGEETGSCDAIVTNFCAKNPKDSLCSCIGSPDDEIPAICINPDCITRGYKPSTLKNYKCADIILNKKNVIVSGQGNIVGSIDGETIPTEPKKNYNFLIIFLFFLFLLVIIFLTYTYVSDSDTISKTET